MFDYAEPQGERQSQSDKSQFKTKFQLFSLLLRFTKIEHEETVFFNDYNIIAWIIFL
jgi:hypothetical protein